MAPRRDLARNTEPVATLLGVIAPPPIHVETPTFEGSLAMLFQCVRQQKVDLLEVPLLPICEAYFGYILHADLADLDEAAAALAALAYLLERKAWLLLPSLYPETEPEFEEPLSLPEPTTHEYAAAIEALRIWHEERASLFFRTAEAGPDPYELPYTLSDVSATDLARAFERLMRRAKPDSIEPLARPRRSLSEQMGVVLRTLGTSYSTLEELVLGEFTRSEAVYWFLALLELIRLGQARVKVDGLEVRFARA